MAGTVVVEFDALLKETERWILVKIWDKEYHIPRGEIRSFTPGQRAVAVSVDYAVRAGLHCWQGSDAVVHGAANAKSDIKDTRGVALSNEEISRRPRKVIYNSVSRGQSPWEAPPKPLEKPKRRGGATTWGRETKQ